MSAPGDEHDRRRLLDVPRWMDGNFSLLSAPAFAAGAVLCAVAFVVLVTAIAAGSLIRYWFFGTTVLAALTLVFVLLYRSASARWSLTRAPTGVPPERLVPVQLVPRGGWLHRYLEPATTASLVVSDDHLRLRWRRAMPQFLLASIVLQFAPMAAIVDVAVPFQACLLGMCACFLLFCWSLVRWHDVRFPWADVHSVSMGHGRFHVSVRDEDYPDGFLLSVRDQLRPRLAELLSPRTLFHEEDRGATRPD